MRIWKVETREMFDGSIVDRVTVKGKNAAEAEKNGIHESVGSDKGLIATQIKLIAEVAD